MRQTIAFLTGLLLTTVLTLGIAMAAKGYTFTNNSGQPRNDMHLEFDQAVTWTPDPPPPFDQSSTQNRDEVYFGRLNGPSVGPGGQVAVTFSTTGTGPTLKVVAGQSQSYWTQNGTRKETINAGNCVPFP